ncbi:MAG: hypothetical protein ACPHSF_08730, partial [Flavobacteriales bacterium]
MREVQFREAVAEAMSEEMRRDKNVFLMGEEVAEYNGAYKASKGMLDEFGPERCSFCQTARFAAPVVIVEVNCNAPRSVQPQATSQPF